MKRKLFLLLALMLGFVSGVKAEITSGTDYVIQNVETGQYLAGGNNWGTQACTRDMPQWFNLTTNGTGYNFDSYQSNGGNNHYLSTGLYVDGAATAWDVAEVSSGVYTIKNGNNYLASNGKNASCTTVTEVNDAARWKIFSRADLTSSILTSASLTNGVDATPYVKWPDFQKRNLTGTSPWTWTGFDGSGTPSNYAQGDGNGSGSWACAESFQSTTGFKTVQTLTNLKPGWYTLKAHGFYRQDGSDTEHYPYIFVGDKKSYFPVLTGGANNMSTAYSAFLADAHKIYPILFYVNSESDNITIGYANENTKMWNIFGETTLTYYGAEAIDAGTDITGLIANHDFGTGTDKGWEFGCDHGIRVGGAEIWHKNNATVKQQLNGLPSGKYTITCQAIHGEGESASSLLYAKSGSAEKTAQAIEPASSSGATAFATETGRMAVDPELGKISVDIVVSDGNLEFGFKQTTNVQWDVFTNFTLTYKGEDISDYIEVYDNANEVATGIDQESPMYVEVLTALQTAISTYGNKNPEEAFATVAEIQEAINALNTAADNATNSIAAYASVNISAYLAKMTTGIRESNVYTTEAYNKWIANVQSNYDNGLYTNQEVSTLTEDGAYSTGWHSTNRVDDVLLSAWTIGGEQCKDYDKSLYINTWSTEGATDGSEFLAPFFEYWVGDGGVLGANTIVATVTGLKASTTYSFTIRARVRQTDGQTKIANGITMKVGEGEAVDISAGTKFNETPFYIGNFSAVGETDGDGKLTATITVAENSNVSWLSFYNAKYTEGEDLSAYIADYEFAKSTAIANRDNVAYAAVTGKEKVDLVNTITTYSDVDETSKAALIEAKEALDAASSTFVAAAPAYIGIAELNPNVAATLGVALPEITSETVAANLDVNGIIVAEYTAAKAYAQDLTARLGAWTDAPGTNKDQSWDGTTGDDADTYYDEYNRTDRAMTQTVTLPAGNYALIAKGRASANGRLTVVVGKETVTFPHKGASGYGIATNGDATFADNAIYANDGNGWGWEYRVITFTSDGETPVTLTFNWKTASSNWCGLDDIELRRNVVSATIGTTGWTTFASAYPLDLSKMTASEGDVKAYYASSQSGNNIVMTSTDQTVAAGEGLMLKGTAGATITIPVAASGDAISGNMLVGCTTLTEGVSGDDKYVLVNNGEGTAEFQNLGTHSANIPAGKAYLNTGVSTARLIISIDDEDPTAINAIEAAEAETGALKDGKYLIGNKIVIVKNGVKYGVNGQKLN